MRRPLFALFWLIAAAAAFLHGPAAHAQVVRQAEAIGLTPAVSLLWLMPGNPQPVPGREGHNIRRIYFGTDREGHGGAFGEDRSFRLQLGVADVSIPPGHRTGKVERPRKMPRAVRAIYQQAPDPARHFTLQAVRTLTPGQFHAGAAAREIAGTPAGTAIIYLHGFNTGFEKAVFRAAQIAHDLSLEGQMFVFSWPSRGRTVSYFTDLDSARSSASRFAAFLDIVRSMPGIRRVHLIAHSMGNETLAAMLAIRAEHIQGPQEPLIDQLILTAPDIDAEIFSRTAGRYRRFARGITMYVCARDKSLILSRSLRDNFARAGDVPPGGPVAAEGIDTIDITAAGSALFSLNHLIWAEQPEVLADLGRLFRNGTSDPKSRMPGLEAVRRGSRTYWRVPG